MSVFDTLKALYKHPSVRSVGVYTFTNFFGKAASFLLLFVFTNPVYITPSENGLLSLFSNSLLFLMPFLSMGIIHSTSAEYFKLPKGEFRDLFTTGLLIPFVVMVLSAILLFLFREQLQRLYGFPYMFAWLIPSITFLTFCGEQLLGLARNRHDPGTYLRANMGKTILELGISVVLVVYFAWRWEGRIAGILVSYLFTGAYAWYYFRRADVIFGKVRKAHLINELVYAVPIILMQASIFSMNSSDKFFLSYFTSDNNQTVGIYSIAGVFASVMLIICTALLQYVFPRIYQELSSKEIRYDVIRKFFWLYMGAMAVSLVALVCLTPLAYHFIHVKYHSALRYLYLLCIGNFLWTVTYFFYSFLLYYKEKRKILVLSVCCIIINTTLNYIFISKQGDWGAAFATVVTYLVVLILTLAITRDHWKKLFPDKAGSKAI